MIYKKAFRIVFYFLLPVSISACAQSKKGTTQKTAQKYVKLIDAAQQVHLPGAPGMEPTTNYKFVVIWKNTTPPESFFWRGADGWMACNITKAKYLANTANSFPYDQSYIQAERIKQGDTLMLVPVRGSKESTPATISTTTKNTLFFKTTKTTWLSLPVNNIKNLPKEIGQ